MTLKEYLLERKQQIDLEIDRLLPPASTTPATLHEAMRYAVFAGGKRLRPILCLAAAEACGGTIKNALPAACAVEVLHTYTLVHDDLPCMDDDDLRRGRPTCHKVYGEGIAVLCGDALLTEAFHFLAHTQPTANYSCADLIKTLAQATGSQHLIGGQVLDLQGEKKQVSEEELTQIHHAKTSALLTASLQLGAMSANANAPNLKSLTKFGSTLGLAFQVIDDILDVTQSTEVLGKTAGKDLSSEKATFPAIIGLEKSRAHAQKLTQEALNALAPFGNKAERLQEITAYLLNREF